MNLKKAIKAIEQMELYHGRAVKALKDRDSVTPGTRTHERHHDRFVKNQEKFGIAFSDACEALDHFIT